MRPVLVLVLVLVLDPPSASADADADAAAAQLAALAPGGDDVFTSVAISFGGAAFLGDGHGTWRRQPGTAVSRTVSNASRSTTLGVVIGADGAIFRLSPTPASWTAIRLAQKGRAILADGPRAVAAIGRDIFELDRAAEPTRLAQASGPVTALAAGPRGIVYRTDRGVVRIAGKAPRPLPDAPREALLVGDHWAISASHTVRASDLTANTAFDLPAGLAFGAATELPDGGLAIAAVGPGGLEWVTIVKGKLAHGPVVLSPVGPAPIIAGIVADPHDRLAIALRDGRIAVRDRGTWSTTSVHDEASPPHPGPAPATMP